MANGTDIEAESQAYFDWLLHELGLQDYSWDEFLDMVDYGGWAWYRLPEKYTQEQLQAARMAADAYNILSQGIWGTSGMYSLPFISEYMAMMQQGQKTFPEQENYPWLEGGQLVAGGQILRTSDGRYVDPNTGIEYDLQTALTMIQNWLGTKDDNSMTEAEEASLNLALQELAWEKEQYGTLSASDKASLQLAYDQLQQTRNEWLVGLKANPADFIEKWYAEHLPAGTQMGETYPWGEPVVGTPEWAQKVGITPQTTVSSGRQAPSTFRGETRGDWASEDNEPKTSSSRFSTWASPNREIRGQTLTPQAYLTMLQAQGIPPSRWISSLGPNASADMLNYIARAKNAIETPLPGGYWSAYSQQPGVGIRKENVVPLGKLSGSTTKKKTKRPYTAGGASKLTG